jgi:O-antigen/teichoic acid export membrane protein
VIEDAAQSFGALYQGRRSGALSTMAATSFFPSKPLGCYGDGGALFTDDDALAQACREIRVHGQSARYLHTRVGVGGRMDTIQCAGAAGQDGTLRVGTAASCRIGARYARLLADVPGVTTVTVRPDRNSVFAQYTVMVDRRDAVAAALKAEGVPTAVHYPRPLHRQPAYEALCCPECCPVSDALAARVLSLPMSADLSDADQDRVVAALLPLLLGPLLTRLYTPTEFGLYHLFAAVAANVAVVACARYEHALPLARDDAEAHALVALCRWILLAVMAFSALGAVAWALSIGALWPLWLPAAVGAFGWLSLATLVAVRAQRFGALATSRVLQHGGGAALQAAAGAAGAGLWGLVVAPIAAALAAAAWLRPRLGQGWTVSRSAMKAVAQRHRDFPVLNTPHAFLGALQDTLAVALIAAWQGPAAAGFWGLALRYLKAPATLVGGAVSQALYPALAAGAAATEQGRSAVRRVMRNLALLALPLVLALWLFAPAAFAAAFGESWREAGELARALALYIGVHFVASPLSVATMAWGAQAWALKLSLVGQTLFIAALASGLAIGGLNAAGWAVSAAMAVYFGWFFWKLATWPVSA